MHDGLVVHSVSDVNIGRKMNGCNGRIQVNHIRKRLFGMQIGSKTLKFQIKIILKILT
jgi:hypothetical protein